MNYIIFDLEATCDDRRPAGFINEIIEIGAVKLDSDLNLVSEFQSFVKPVINPVLTDFCKGLTTISQEDVDGAGGFRDVINQFRNWCGDGSVLCSWGHYDKNQLISDMRYHGEYWSFRHISIKHQYADIKGLRRGVGVKAALHMEGLEFEGVHHRGIDDARNISRIFIKCFEDLKFG